MPKGYFIDKRLYLPGNGFLQSAEPPWDVIRMPGGVGGRFNDYPANPIPLYLIEIITKYSNRNLPSYLQLSRYMNQGLVPSFLAQQGY